ncbi:MAG: hypothetical protein AAB492_00035 [Patescibacteria group bacterium]
MKKIYIPRHIHVQIEKGDTGALVATLPSFDAVTEASDLSELFFNVNDLIYSIFDIPKRLQKNIQYIPTKESQLTMIRIQQAPKEQFKEKIEIQRYNRETSPLIHLT